MKQLTCQAFIEFINDYLEGRLDPDQQTAFAEHLTACKDCKSYLDTYQDSMVVFKTVCEEEDKLPEDVPADLVNGIMTALDRKSE